MREKWRNHEDRDFSTLPSSTIYSNTKTLIKSRPSIPAVPLHPRFNQPWTMQYHSITMEKYVGISGPIQGQGQPYDVSKYYEKTALVRPQGFKVSARHRSSSSGQLWSYILTKLPPLLQCTLFQLSTQPAAVASLRWAPRPSQGNCGLTDISCYSTLLWVLKIKGDLYISLLSLKSLANMKV